jgi:hypothetical protein
MATRQQTPRKHKMLTTPDSQALEPPRKKRSDEAAALSLMDQQAKQEVEDLCRFFGCAREIRDMIYHHLWKDTPQMLVAWKPAGDEAGDDDEAGNDEVDNEKDPSRAGAPISAFYDSWPDDPSGTSKGNTVLHLLLTHRTPLGPKQALPQWLLTNKQMLAEGIKQFERRSVWCVFDPGELTPNLAIQRLLHPATASDVIVYLHSLSIMYYLEAYPSNIMRRWIKGRNDSLDALYGLLLANDGEDGPRLRILEFRSPVRYLKLGYHPHLYSFFLALEDDESDNEEEGDEDGDADVAPEPGDAVRDGYPPISTTRDLFDLSSLEPPAELSSGIKQFHVEVRYKNKSWLPPSAQRMMYEGISVLGSAIVSDDFRLFAGVVNVNGAAGLCFGERFEFRRGTFRPSRESERSGTRVVWIESPCK